jgi:hypothetical protein
MHLLSCPIHQLSPALPHASFDANEMSAYLRTPISARAQTGPTRTHFPLTRHFFSASSSDASSRAATARSTPTTTSALFVRRLRSGNAPASGPARARSAESRDGRECKRRTERGRERGVCRPADVARELAEAERCSPVREPPFAQIHGGGTYCRSPCISRLSRAPRRTSHRAAP